MVSITAVMSEKPLHSEVFEIQLFSLPVFYCDILVLCVFYSKANGNAPTEIKFSGCDS